MVEAYDPLDYDNLARNVVTALLANEVGPLPPTTSFDGCGVYAIYYTGSLPFYKKFSSAECAVPIYVGKAIPVGARKGGSREDKGGMELYRRLLEHAKSVSQAENLCEKDFKCRYLVVIPVWITLAERFLIDHFRPVWNTVIDGFGNHPPGAGRKDMRRPRWDILHPGRPWAQRLRADETADQVLSLIDRMGK